MCNSFASNKSEDFRDVASSGVAAEKWTCKTKTENSNRLDSW